MAKNSSSEDIIKGGLSDKMTLRDIANKHGVPLAQIQAQHKKGIKVEMEHTNDPKIASEISKDHLVENPKYYDYLSTMENKMDKEVAVTANGKNGGLLAGKAHSQCDENGCGIKAVVVSDNGGKRDVELEDEESIINKRTMKDPSIYTVTGTPAEIASAINTIDDNGVAFAKKVPVRKVKHVVKMQKGGKFSATPAELAGILDELFKDHCDAFAFAQGISRTNSSNVAENTALLVAEWNSKIKAHFTEEEDQLFPLIKDVSNDFLIDELIAEHIRFEHAVTSIESSGSATPTGIRSLAKLLMVHIQKEDALFMRYGENKYSSSMELVESKDNVHECVYCVRGTKDQIRAAAERHMLANGGIADADADDSNSNNEKITNLAIAKTNDKMEKIKFSEEALNFVPKHQLSIVNKSDEFDEVVERINKVVAEMPSTYDTESIKDKTIWLHYFYGNQDWYIFEKDKGDGSGDMSQLQAYGYADLGQGAEMGYINIDDLINLGSVELDLYFTPKKWSEIQAEKNPEMTALESDEKLANELINYFEQVYHDQFHIESMEDLWADFELQKNFIAALSEKLEGKFSLPLSSSISDELEDANAHTLNEFLALSGAFGDERKKEVADRYFKRNTEYRQFHLNPAIFGIEGIEQENYSAKSPEEILGTIAALEEVIKKNKNLKTEKWAVDEALGSYVRIVYENPLFYTRYTDFVSDTLRSSQYYIQYSGEANAVVRDADTFHNNIVAGGLNIWNLIPEKFKVSPKVRPVAFKTTPDDKELAALHSNFINEDSLRPILFKTHFDETGVVSTNAYVLIFTKKKESYKTGDYCLTKDCFKLKEEFFEGKKYPDYKRTVPSISEDGLSFIRVNHESILLYLNTLKKLKLMASNRNEEVIIEINGSIFGFNLQYLMNGIEAMIKMGHNDISMGYSATDRGVVLFPTMNKELVDTHKTDFVLVMPVELTHGTAPVYDLFSNCISNQGSDVCLTNYESEAKYKALEKKTAELEKKSIIARPAKKVYNRVAIESEISALEIALEHSDDKDRKAITKAITMLKDRLEDMGETKECGGYVLEQEGVIIEEIYPENLN